MGLVSKAREYMSNCFSPIYPETSLLGSLSTDLFPTGHFFFWANQLRKTDTQRFVPPGAKTCLKPTLCFLATAFIFSLNFKVHFSRQLYSSLKHLLFSGYFCFPNLGIFYFLVSSKGKGGSTREGKETYLFDEFWYLILMLKKISFCQSFRNWSLWTFKWHIIIKIRIYKILKWKKCSWCECVWAHIDFLRKLIVNLVFGTA